MQVLNFKQYGVMLEEVKNKLNSLVECGPDDDCDCEPCKEAQAKKAEEEGEEASEKSENVLESIYRVLKNVEQIDEAKNWVGKAFNKNKGSLRKKLGFAAKAKKAAPVKKLNKNAKK